MSRRAARQTSPRRTARPRPGAAHRAGQAAPRPVRIAVVTVSDTRRGADDTGGARAQALAEAAGVIVAVRAWVGDDAAAIRRTVRDLLAQPELDAIVLTGGTGLAPRDVTPEALAPLIERPLPGFGEAFRSLSLAQVGAAAWLSRAGAGVARGRLVVMLPGSIRAVELAMTQLLLPELVHALRMLGRFQPGD